MALFPECKFQVFLTNGEMTSGRRVEGVLELEVPEPIPRAEHVDLSFRSRAWAGYQAGNSRWVIQRNIFYTILHVDLPVGKALAAGRHRYPFTFDMPPWVPPTFAGNDCAIQNTIVTRLDVEWAKDPALEMVPRVVCSPGEAVVTPLVTRSHEGFHESLVIEVTLESSIIVEGQPIVGRLAVRGGHGARFDAIELTLQSLARITMYRGDVRRSPASMKVRIPDDVLRRGESVPFVVMPYAATPCTFQSGFIDHAMTLDVSVDIPWASDPKFTIPVFVHPAGTRLYANPAAQKASAVVGSDRLQLLASYMAQASGLRPGRLPTLVEGRIGSVDVRIIDSARAGRLGLDVELVFPDLEIGVVFRTLGFLDGQSALVPEPLRGKYVVRFAPIDARPRLEDERLAGLVHSVLAGLETVEELRFSDHYLGYHVPLENDQSDYLQAIARAVCAKAKALAAATAALPFPSAAAVLAAAPAWLATSAEQSAALVPTGPSLHGLVFKSRVLGGEERVLFASMRTVWRKEGPATVVDLDLRGMPFPPEALQAISTASPAVEGLLAVREVFPSVHATTTEHAVLERAELTADPRSLFVGIEAFVAWLLDVRGERRADVPYR
jgi:hypothetical protein